MHIEFDIEESKMRYDSGDHLAVYPINNTELVEKVCSFTVSISNKSVVLF